LTCSGFSSEIFGNNSINKANGQATLFGAPEPDSSMRVFSRIANELPLAGAVAKPP
jgi:hypothetical protein